MPLFDPTRFLPHQGIIHPFSFSAKTVVMDGIDYLRNGMVARLDIAFFELLMKPEGSRLHQLLFEPLDGATIDLVRVYAAEALRNFSQIQIQSITVSPSAEDANGIMLIIQFYVKQTNIMETLRLDLTFRDLREV